MVDGKKTFMKEFDPQCKNSRKVVRMKHVWYGGEFRKNDYC